LCESVDKSNSYSQRMGSSILVSEIRRSQVSPLLRHAFIRSMIHRNDP